jgi:hypothetical protein
MHRAIFRGQNCLKWIPDRPLHWEMAGAVLLETFATSLLLDNFDDAECIPQQWVEMFLRKYASEIWVARKKECRGNKRWATDIVKRASNKAGSNLHKLQNTMFMVLIH